MNPDHQGRALGGATGLATCGGEELNDAVGQNLSQWKQPPIAVTYHVVGSERHGLDAKQPAVRKSDFCHVAPVPKNQNNTDDQPASDQGKDSLSHDSVASLVSLSSPFGNRWPNADARCDAIIPGAGSHPPDNGPCIISALLLCRAGAVGSQPCRA